MDDGLIYKSITDSLTLPVMAAMEVPGTDDYEIVYVNAAFEKAIDCVRVGERISEITKSIPVIDWVDLVRSAKSGTDQKERKFLFETKNVWYKIEIHFCENGILSVSLFDITTKTMYNERLREAVFTDTLTALPNRMQFNKRYSELIQSYPETKRRFALIVFDLDNMKTINDSKGQMEGDRLLIKAARIFLNFEKGGIEVFRFGDDEFALLALDIQSVDSALTIADAVGDACGAQDISISGGVALFPDDSANAEDLLKFADLAMHTAKVQGRHRSLCFTPEMQKEFLRKANYKAKMPAAFENSEFKLYFQPQFDIRSNSLRGFEALLRWKNEEFGKVSPEEFIPVAEESGFIVKLGAWILETAFSYQKRWEDMFGYKGIMSVNVSPVQLREKDFLETLLNIAEKTGINPSHVEIEITEGVLINDTEDAVEKLRSIKDVGFGLSLDDFGTGYSSLRYLQLLPLTTLKIDKSFIQSITDDNSISADITNAIISMVTKMGLDTIAEGVEKVDQLKILQDLNCKNIQGFLRGKPMSPERIEAYLSGDTLAIDTI